MAKKTAWFMDYETMRPHVGHKIVLNDVWDWQTNREIGMEIRCEDCENEPPLFECDSPKEYRR